jgi:hypothetical protein
LARRVFDSSNCFFICVILNYNRLVSAPSSLSCSLDLGAGGMNSSFPGYLTFHSLLRSPPNLFHTSLLSPLTIFDGSWLRRRSSAPTSAAASGYIIPSPFFSSLALRRQVPLIRDRSVLRSCACPPVSLPLYSHTHTRSPHTPTRPSCSISLLVHQSGTLFLHSRAQRYVFMLQLNNSPATLQRS